MQTGGFAVPPERPGEAVSNFLDLSVRSGRSRQPKTK
jgi:hypothetical protein